MTTPHTHGGGSGAFMFLLGYFVALLMIVLTLAITLPGCAHGRRCRYEAQRGVGRTPDAEPCPREP